ncbi:MAG: chromosome segregation protein SMC [Candidatus Bathyarchaeia archaeon]
MYIRRIDLKGFKTFNHKVSLNLDRGLTVITGPNGSGKSNIMDAIKFALGELSPKMMRGSSLEDVISKTSPASPAKSAYVAIQFDNADRRIPIDSDTVTVSRQFAKGGEGIYRVNGKRVSRKQVNDMLSSAGISVSGLNIVPQHTITRLAEVTSEERRKILEDMIGIGVYDSKKAEASIQLQQADINIRVASAKVDEVRSRVCDLERERNDLLRSRFLKEEINRLQGVKISYQIRSLEEEILDLRNQFNSLQSLVDRLRSEREEVATRKTALDKERIEFEQTVLDKRNEQLFDLERRISAHEAEMAKLSAEVEALQGARATLEKQLQGLRKNIDETKRKIAHVEEEVHEYQDRRSEADKEIRQKMGSRDELIGRLRPLREQAIGALAEYDSLNTELNSLLEQRISGEAQAESQKARLEMICEALKRLGDMGLEHDKMAAYLRERAGEAEALIESCRQEIEELEEKIERHRLLIEARKLEVAEAQETIRKAKDAIAQAQAQLEAHQRINPEEKIRRILKEMGKRSGICGRLRNLLEIPQALTPAIEAAAEGWLDALVVDGLEEAVSCIEILKKQKIGRIKIIPLSSVLTAKRAAEVGNIQDGALNAADAVSCDQRFKPAVDFVLGDTFIAPDEKSAFILSLNGVRAVSRNGDLFEPEGVIEGGYFRDSLDLWSIMTVNEIADLERMVSNLEEISGRSLRDIERLVKEAESLQASKTERESLTIMKREELKGIKAELEKVETASRENLARIEKMKNERTSLERGLEASRLKISELEEKIKALRARAGEARSKIGDADLKDAEKRVEALTSDIESISRRLIEAEGRIQALRSSRAIYERSLQESLDQTRRLEEQLERTSSEVNERLNMLDQKGRILETMKEEKRSIVSQITTAKASRRSFDQELKVVEERLKTLYRECDEKSSLLSQLGTKIKEREVEKSFLYRDLGNLHFQAPLPFTEEEVAGVDPLIEQLRRELDEIGAINELAADQYDEYKSNYQQLSVRINALEEEKLSILRFMNELDQKKREAFTSAFNQVNQNFSEIFSAVTEGGSGRLVLENEEEPFSGGIEVLLRFPGKEEFSISGASGGERSVATVCFIIALQAIHPMPFYMFDEIDAHLDPLNSQRLADELKKRSAGSQFILISLKDTTISRADKVYGVYIESGGSKIVSLPLKEVA